MALQNESYNGSIICSDATSFFLEEKSKLACLLQEAESYPDTVGKCFFAKKDSAEKKSCFFHSALFVEISSIKIKDDNKNP